MSEIVKAAGILTSPEDCSARGGGDNGKEIDKKCPFELLPEIMEAIFEKLGSEDLQTCLNTCDQWIKLLESKKNLFQFELVLPILLRMKVLPFEDCLNVRLVCGKWKQGVDNILQNHQSRLNLPEESRVFALRVPRTAGADVPCAQLQSMERLFGDFGMYIWGSWFYFLSPRPINWTTERGFVDQLLAHPTNPFVGRSLTLRTNHWMDYCDLGRSLLERFGKDLWFLCYRIDDSTQVGTVPVEVRIRDALLHLPNLKWMRLDVSLHQNEDEQETILETRVRQYFQRNPLPRLQNLETFTCGGLFRNPPIFLCSILESCCVPENLKRLNLAHSKLNYKPTFKFPNLEELGIRMELKNLRSLRETSPRLRKIWLILTNPAEDGTLQDMDSGLLFLELEAFQETLSDLCIGRELQEVEYSICWNADFRILLPNLELLVLDCEIPPDCLENLGSLKHLGFRNYNEDEEVESYKLSVGRVVPSLKTLQCNGVISKIKMRGDLTTGSSMVQNKSLWSKITEWAAQVLTSWESV